MLRFMAAVVVLSFSVAGARAANTLSLLGSDQGFSGTSVTFDLDCANDMEIRGLSASLLFDAEVLEFQSATVVGTRAQDPTMDLVTGSTDRWLAAGVVYRYACPGIPAGSGSVMRVTFRIRPDAPPGVTVLDLADDEQRLNRLTPCAGPSLVPDLTGKSFTVTTECTRADTLRYPQWEWVTVGLRPTSTAAPDVFASLLPNLSIITDDAGHVYIPGLLDNLSPVDFRNAFQVMLAGRADTLAIAGVPADVSQDCVPIAPGRWNLIPYLTDRCEVTCASDVSVAMAAIANCLTIVKDNDGRVWIPALHLNTIGLMNPRRGYYVFLNQECTQEQSLCYPPCSPAPRMELESVEATGSPKHFVTAPTGLSEAVVVMNTNGVGLSGGDEVALFSGGRAVGSVVYPGMAPFVIPVWRGDEQHGLHGLVAGGPMQARLWSRGQGGERTVEVQAENGSPAIFAFDPYVRVGLREASAPIATTLRAGILQLRPNPMRGEVEIRYRASAESDVRIGIYDVAGRVRKEFVERMSGAGEQSVVWDGTDRVGRHVPGGTYFVRLTPGNGPAQQKLLVIR